MRPITVRLTNQWVYFVSENVAKHYDKLITYFRFRRQGYYFSPLYKDHKWDGYIKLLKNGKVATGLFLFQRDKIEQETKLRFEIIDERKAPKFSEFVPAVEKAAEGEADWRHQDKAVRRMIRHSNFGGMLLSATGTGKTRIAGRYFQHLQGAGVFVVNELSLLKQSQLAIQKVLGEKVGYIGDSKFKPKRITVATVQTLHLHRHDPRFRKWQKSLQVMIIDELHEMLSQRNHETVLAIKPKAVFGLTATLECEKPSVFYKALALTGPPIFQFPLSEAQKKKVLSPGIAVCVTIESKGVSKYWRHWDRYDKLISKSRAWNDAVEAIARAAISAKKFVLVYAERPKHVRILSRRFEDIPHRMAFGEISVRDRRRAIKELGAKKIRLIIANRVFKKGTDIPRVDVVIDAAAGKSTNDTQQKFGRGVRLCDGKVGLIYFDIGHKNPPGASRSDDDWNKYWARTLRRRKALKDPKLGIPVYTIDWGGDADEVYAFAERKLNKLLRSLR